MNQSEDQVVRTNQSECGMRVLTMKDHIATAQSTIFTNLTPEHT